MMNTSVHLDGLMIILAGVFFGLLLFQIILLAIRKEEHLDPGHQEENTVVRTEVRPVTLTATRRMSPQMYLDLAARYGKHPETMFLWMAEKMITADAGELAKLSRVTVARDPKRDEYVFRMTLIVVPAENEVTDDG